MQRTQQLYHGACMLCSACCAEPVQSGASWNAAQSTAVPRRRARHVHAAHEGCCACVMHLRIAAVLMTRSSTCIRWHAVTLSHACVLRNYT
jgi:hypothetical protein